MGLISKISFWCLLTVVTISVIRGPMKNLLSHYTTFVTTKSLSEADMPMPDFSVCKVGGFARSFKDSFLEFTIRDALFGPTYYTGAAEDFSQTPTDNDVLKDCYTIRLDGRVKREENFVMELVMDWSVVTSTYYMTMHPQNEPFLAGFSMDRDFISMGAVVAEGQLSMQFVIPKAVFRLTTDDCIAHDDDYKISACVNDYLDSKFKDCPYQSLLKENCSQDSRRSRLDEYWELRVISYKSFKENSGCPRPCKSFEYSLERMFDIASQSIEVVRTNATTIIIFYQYESTVWLAEETRGYDFGDFLADAGGLSGMFLGLSFQSFFSWIESVAGKYAFKSK